MVVTVNASDDPCRVVVVVVLTILRSILILIPDSPQLTLLLTTLKQTPWSPWTCPGQLSRK